jgi:hypothetical protein
MKFTVKHNGQPTASPSAALESAKRKLSMYEEKHIKAIAMGALQEFIDRVNLTMRSKHGRAWPGGTGANTLSRRSGRGLAALGAAKLVRRTRSIAAVFTLPRYLAMQEFGVISTAKGRFLTIPLPAALNADGTPKKRSARQWRGTFLVKGKKGQWIVCTKRGRRIIPLYVLKPTVRIAPRLGLRKVMRKELQFFARSLALRVKHLLQETS